MTEKSAAQKVLAVKYPSLIYLRSDGDGGVQLVVGVDERLIVMPLSNGQLSNIVVDGAKMLAKKVMGLNENLELAN